MFIRFSLFLSFIVLGSKMNPQSLKQCLRKKITENKDIGFKNIWKFWIESSYFLIWIPCKTSEPYDNPLWIFKIPEISFVEVVELFPFDLIRSTKLTIGEIAKNYTDSINLLKLNSRTKLIYLLKPNTISFDRSFIPTLVHLQSWFTYNFGALGCKYNCGGQPWCTWSCTCW